MLWSQAVLADAECGCIFSQAPCLDRQNPICATEGRHSVRMGGEHLLRELVKFRRLCKGTLGLDGER
jgi:hypothetical protein